MVEAFDAHVLERKLHNLHSLNVGNNITFLTSRHPKAAFGCCRALNENCSNISVTRSRRHAVKRWTKKVADSSVTRILLGGNSLNFHHPRRLPHWDKEQAKQRILDIFEHKIEQEWINKLVLSMPQRLQDCLSRGGALTGW